MNVISVDPKTLMTGHPAASRAPRTPGPATDTTRAMVRGPGLAEFCALLGLVPVAPLPAWSDRASRLQTDVRDGPCPGFFGRRGIRRIEDGAVRTPTEPLSRSGQGA